MIHELKTHKRFYQDVIEEKKKFELRKDDRSFQVHDCLDLIEVDEDNNLIPTGRKCRVLITHILRDCPEFGLKEGFAAISIYLLMSNR